MKRNLTEIKVVAYDPEGKLIKLLKYIKTFGGFGHSFKIIMDPGDEREDFIYWDGDGWDKIKVIEEKEVE